MADNTKPACKLIHASAQYTGKQTFTYFEGISSENSDASRICMHLMTIPPGAQGKTHLHEDHETALYILSGEGRMWYGEQLKEHLVARPGDFLYIPAGVPHLPYNASDEDPFVAVVARTDPNEQESVVLLPEMDALATSFP